MLARYAGRVSIDWSNLVLLAMVSCTSSNEAHDKKPVASEKQPAAAQAQEPQTEPTIEPNSGPNAAPIVFFGSCDPSGAVVLASGLFAVADDEDNLLRIYDADKGGPPLRTIDVSRLLEIDKKRPESDLEAATRIGEVAYWVSSHARKAKGKVDSIRMFFFASQLPSLEGDLDIIGEPYRGLQRDLLAEPQLAGLGLQEAALKPPKQGGFNIEGLTGTPDKTLLLGFRNPVPDGLALVVPIENPAKISWGTRPTFGKPIRLDLGGLGVRALSHWRGKYLIAAGPQSQGELKMFAWAGPGHAPTLISDDLQGLNPEAFFTPEDRDDILILSDDGAERIGGEECKDLKDPTKKQFRALRLRPY